MLRYGTGNDHGLGPAHLLRHRLAGDRGRPEALARREMRQNVHSGTPRPRNSSPSPWSAARKAPSGEHPRVPLRIGKQLERLELHPPTHRVLERVSRLALRTAPVTSGTRTSSPKSSSGSWKIYHPSGPSRPRSNARPRPAERRVFASAASGRRRGLTWVSRRRSRPRGCAGASSRPGRWHAGVRLGL